jgi:hypothetical protein
VFSIIIGGAMVVIGLLVGFTQKTTSQYGGAQCGSVLGGGGEDLTTTGVAVCQKALSTATTWTWILLIVGALIIVGGMIVNSMQQRSHVAVN